MPRRALNRELWVVASKGREGQQNPVTAQNLPFRSRLLNLLPLPPSDGGHVVEGIPPRRLAYHYAKLGRFGFLLVIGLLVLLRMSLPHANIVPRLIGPLAEAVIQLFLKLARAIT